MAPEEIRTINEDFKNQPATHTARQTSIALCTLAVFFGEFVAQIAEVVEVLKKEQAKANE